MVSAWREYDVPSNSLSLRTKTTTPVPFAAAAGMSMFSEGHIPSTPSYVCRQMRSRRRLRSDLSAVDQEPYHGSNGDKP